LNNNSLKEYFNDNSKRLIHKWDHYFDIYETHFDRYVDKELVVLEIGVSHGGSLQMWKKYFGEKVKIYGVDNDPRCKSLEEDGIEILIGSQNDKSFLKKLKKKIPKIDILIDDGGHTMEQQITTFKELFNHIKDDGVYLCEDLHTSYWLKYGGGLKRSGTFIEFSKNWIDFLNAYHSHQKSFQPNEFTRTVNSIHYYDSIVIIQKKIREKPKLIKSGLISFENKTIDEEELRKLKFRLYMIKKKIINFSLTIINKFLRRLRISSFIWK